MLGVIAGIVLAGAIGTTFRVLATDLDADFNRQLDGTLFVNVVGSFLLGVLAGSEANVAIVAGIGGLGSLTTFSTFISQVECIGREASVAKAVLYVVASLVGGIGAAYIGWVL